MRVIYSVLVAILFVSLFVFGSSLQRATGSTLIALASQLFVCAAPPVTYVLLRIGPESLILPLGLLVSAALAQRLAPNTHAVSRPFGLGVLVSTSIFSKLTALPYLFLTLGAGSRSVVLRVMAGIGVTSLLWTLFLYPGIARFSSFYSRFVVGSGNYGYDNTESGFWDVVTENVRSLSAVMPVELIALAILTLMVALIFHFTRRVPSIVLIILGLSVLSIVVMLRQPMPRYFIPMIPPLSVVFAWILLSVRGNLRLVGWPKTLANSALLAVLAGATVFQIVRLDEQSAARHDFVANWTSRSKEVSKHGDCYVMRPLDQTSALYFGNQWARSDYLAKLLDSKHPNFVIYNHDGRRELYKFSGLLTRREIQETQRLNKPRLCAMFRERFMAWGLDEAAYTRLMTFDVDTSFGTKQHVIAVLRTHDYVDGK